MRIAFYDLDETLTAQATFTPFLIFAARRLAPYRLLFAPVWVMAMACYKAGLYDRTALKQLGMKMMLGHRAEGDLSGVGRDFARAHIARKGWRGDIIALLETERGKDARIVMATAAFEFYARAFAEMLDIDDVIGTHWDGEGVPGGNCYGRAKYDRVLDWMAAQGFDRSQAHISMASDSFSDAPLLDWADEGIFVTDSVAKAKDAREKGWQVAGRTG